MVHVALIRPANLSRSDSDGAAYGLAQKSAGDIIAISLYLSIFLSLSLSIYIYIYIYKMLVSI